ncbi:MAG: tRNA (adenosine(37)-N6)-threonylcarbamoyltransferase complex dimerization subunit type 1 TsaB [Chloroflexi bacterium RBG_19FT_COMBO_50_10]|nr:MAG: tRNA (adenosine(37)-N6)-threonylcarbamoyltransferase complex dimerization subunit type 1 TsaB [Chloroflexi bacterium RBG_16_47_49]OGO66127.1 MAG: tRNA (adenosine(37)-N6)-threonylcarbamoyltransferase complex dimerization subunit type 1 TsaB [Chloroflexi bacterium RBG_19FT_COMBO_50_10]
MLLALDTSTRNIGIAIYDGIQVLCEYIWTSHDYHTVELAPAVADTLSRAGVEIQNLKLLAVATGPGSFTGLRIGMALAKGIALARHLPIIGIPTLDVVAESQPVSPGFTLAAILQAGRGRLAVGWYIPVNGTWQLNLPIEVMDVLKLSRQIHEPTLVCGELNEEQQHALARKYKNVILASPAHSIRRPSLLAELAWKRWQAGEVDDPATLSPTYLHLGEPIPG